MLPQAATPRDAPACVLPQPKDVCETLDEICNVSDSDSDSGTCCEICGAAMPGSECAAPSVALPVLRARHKGAVAP